MNKLLLMKIGIIGAVVASTLFVFLPAITADYSLPTQGYIKSLNLPLLEPKDPKVRIIIAGDANLAIDLGRRIEQSGFNPFSRVNKLFSEYDLRVINLETNISRPGVGSPLAKNFTFNAPLAVIDSMVAANIDLVSLANNHTMDFGSAALVDQIDNLGREGIIGFGAGKNIRQAYAPKYVTIEETKIAFIGVNDIENLIKPTPTSAGIAYLDEGRVRSAVQKAEEKADVVIVYAHWGREHSLQFNSRQEYWAKLFVDAGADLVVGAHPHVRQPHKKYQGVDIYYSLGNFIFSGMTWSDEAVQGNMLEVVIEDNQILSTKLIPIQINALGVPRLVE